jgi:ribonuclease HI
LRALQSVDKKQPVQIFTDSQYSIRCVTEWYRGWMKNGWKTSQGEPVTNQDLVKAVRKVMDARDKAGTRTVIRWIKGHASDQGNVAADKLAVQGAKLP